MVTSQPKAWINRGGDGDATDVDPSQHAMELQMSLTQTVRKLERAEEKRESSRNAVRKHQPWDRRIALAQERLVVQECPVASDHDKHRHQTEHNPHGMLGLE